MKSQMVEVQTLLKLTMFDVFYGRRRWKLNTSSCVSLHRTAETRAAQHHIQETPSPPPKISHSCLKLRSSPHSPSQPSPGHHPHTHRDAHFTSTGDKHEKSAHLPLACEFWCGIRASTCLSAVTSMSLVSVSLCDAHCLTYNILCATVS